MNMNMLMQQAQKMQKDINKTTEEIAKQKFSGKQDLVEIIITGDKKVVDVKINEEITPDDREILQDMILLAFNDALAQVDKAMDEKLGKYKGIPGLF